MPEPGLGLVAALAVALGWLAVGLAGLLRPHSTFVVSRLLFPLGAAGSVLSFRAELLPKKKKHRRETT